MRLKREPVVVIPLDGSEASAAALGAAQALTDIVGGVLHVVHVTEAPLPLEELQDHLKIAEVFDHFPHQLSGDVVGSIIEFALGIEANIIVMSSHGATYHGEDLLGSKALSLVQRINIPIMVIHPGIKNVPDENWKPKKMLVPLGGAPRPAGVFSNIFWLAEILGVEINVLNVAVSGKEPPSEAGTYTSPRYLDHPYYDWPAWADEFRKRLLTFYSPKVKLRLFHEYGNPVDVVLRFASEHDEDIIALSWRGRMDEERAGTVKGILRGTELPILLMSML